MPCLQFDRTSCPGKLLIRFGYNPVLIDAVKSVGCRWSPTGKETNNISKVWWTSDPKIIALLEQCADMDNPRDVHQQLAATRKASVEASYQADTDFQPPVPQGIHPMTGKPFQLMPFQRAGVEFCIQRNSALIGDAPGLGKTLQAIGVANCMPDFKRGLFVCPATLKSNWYREIKLWLVHPNKSVGIAQGSYWPDTDIVIVNYDILLRHRESVEEVEWDLVVLDEAHYIKSAKAQRTYAILGNKKMGLKPIRAKRKLALTGTPILNRPGELFSILHWLDPNAWPSRFYFAQRYCAGGYGLYDGASNLEELQLRLRSTLLIRRLKENVLKELPPKLRSVVEYDDPDLRLEVEEEVRSMRAREAALASLRAAVELAKASDNPQEYKAAVEALRTGLSVAFAEIAELRARTAVAKIPHVIAHIKDIIENTSDKVVVFAHHREVVERICSAFPWLSVKLYGGMSEAAKDGSVTAFQTDPNVRIFVGSILAAGVGLTLTAAHRLVFAELDWTPSNVTQAEDRCHRVGQREQVLVQHIVLSGSLDATIARKLVAKQLVIDRALDEVERLEHDTVIPTTEPELEEVARVEDIDRDAHTFSAEDRQRIYGYLRSINVDNVASPVEVIVVTRLREIPLEAMNNRQVALAYRICVRNFPQFSLTSSPPADTIQP